MSVAVADLLARFEREPRRFRLPFVLPGRNQLDAAQRKQRWVGRRLVTAYDELKRKAHDDVLLFAGRARLTQAPGRVIVATIWTESDRRRDPDNIVSGGRKLILDAIGTGRKGVRGWRGAGLLHCDGWHCIAGFADVVILDARAPGVEVVIADVQLPLPLAAEPSAALIDLRGPGVISLCVPRRAWVTEWHTLKCSVCGDHTWCLAIFVGKRWQSGADPEGPATLALCRGCIEGSDVGPYVGPDVP